MSEATAAPAAPAAPAPADSGPRSTNVVNSLPPEAGALTIKSGENRAAKAVEALRKARDNSDAPASEKPAKKAAKQAVAPTTPEAQEASTEPAKQSDAPAAEQPKQAEPPSDYEAKIARALTGTREAERKAREAQAALEAATAKIKALEDLEKLIESNPLEALKRKGKTFEELARAVAEGKVTPATAEDLARDKQSDELAELKKFAEEIRQEREQLKQRAIETEEIEIVTKRIAERAESSPVLAALGWAPKVARDQFYAARRAGQEVEFDDVLQRMESAASADVRSVLANERAVRALLASDKSLRETVAKALGVSDKQRAATEPQGKPTKTTGQTATSDEPATLLSSHAAVPGRETPTRISPDQRRNAAIAALLRKRA